CADPRKNDHPIESQRLYHRHGGTELSFCSAPGRLFLCHGTRANHRSVRLCVAGRKTGHTRQAARRTPGDNMTLIFGVPLQMLLGQLLLGLVNGSFYAVLSLGLAVIFGLLNIINFTHGAFYMLGAFVAWMGLQYLGLNYWLMLLLAPLTVGLFGILVERLL